MIPYWTSARPWDFRGGSTVSLPGGGAFTRQPPLFAFFTPSVRVGSSAAASCSCIHVLA